MSRSPSRSSSSLPKDHYENPYYLHNSDHAGLILVTGRLSSGADFHSWRRSVRMALNVRNKLGFIDGTIPKPSSDHREFGAWSRCNDMVSTWLMNSVSKKIGQSLLFMSSAEKIWKNLLTRFKQDDTPRIFEIEQRLSALQQGSLDISTYYTDLVTLWEEHQNFVDLPICTCGKCECNAAASWEHLQQRSRVTKFLMGLNEAYDSTRRHILMLKPIPSMEEVFNMVAQDERQKMIKAPTKIDHPVFQNSTSSDATQNFPQDNLAYAVAYKPRQRPVCTHCGMVGHIVQKCYKFHGYPPGHRLFNSSNNASQRSSGHTSQGQLNRAPMKTNAVANVECGSSLDLSQFSNEQMTHLLQQLQSHATFNAPAVNFTSANVSITEDGIVSAESSCGTVPFPSSNLRFEHGVLTFHHHALHTLAQKISPQTWIIDSGATTHALTLHCLVLLLQCLV